MNPGSKEQLYAAAQELPVENITGPILVVAPHPDDESLGCGGTIALLRQHQVPVQVVFTSDGSMSHPCSKKFPSEMRVHLREAEALTALQLLGVNRDAVYFMRLKDAAVPTRGQEGFDEAVAGFGALLLVCQPSTILVPWRLDPHPDHRASWQIVQAATDKYLTGARMLEYLVWLWERGEAADLPTTTNSRLWSIDIERVYHLKQEAVIAHRSQVTGLIDDDPSGFLLTPDLLAHFSGNREIFAEVLKG